MAKYPDYPFPRKLLLDLALAALTGHRRSFTAHACQMISTMRPPLVVEGIENIPQAGPVIITCNHYCRPGFWTPWLPAAISATIPIDIYWTMTDALTLPGHPLHLLWRGLTHWALTRIARAYGFNTMPPMPPWPQDANARAAAVQRLVRYARANPRAVIGLAPEGGDQPGGKLILPPEGFGRLALALSKMGATFIPVGVYEADGCLRVCFGARYHLTAAGAMDRHTADLQAREQVMRAIAACLPESLRGKLGKERLTA